jgi:hypothetical protein
MVSLDHSGERGYLQLVRLPAMDVLETTGAGLTTLIFDIWIFMIFTSFLG